MKVAIRGLGPKCGSLRSRTGCALSPAHTLLGGPEFESRTTAFHQDFISYHGNESSSAALLYYTRFLRCRQAAQHSQGIQTLLEAEKDAAKVVGEARQCACLKLPLTAFTLRFSCYCISHRSSQTTERCTHGS
jgi:hypothetical protein